MKRKIEEISQLDPSEDNIEQESLKLEDYLSRFKRSKQNPTNDKENKKSQDSKIKIHIKEQIAIEKGCYNLPKELIEEAFAVFCNVTFKPKRDTGRQTYYYDCIEDDCSYKIKITENKDCIKQLIATNLISNFKNFDISASSEQKEGMCHLTEYGDHSNDHHKKADNKNYFHKNGNSNKFFFF